MVEQLVSLVMAESRQSRAHEGMSLRDWARAAAARARATKAYFILKVVERLLA